ncbi:MAG: TerC family protein [Alphaproteobacteria bacterium]|nr:TerC family protein [Alphaproteobacteria bacterium]
MEWMFEPTAWAGLATLVVLEIVLGIDNLIFIAILSDKLAPHQRQKARMVGLSFALLMRLVLLAAISWMTKLTDPLFAVIGHEISGRDLIMLVGGVFLLFKGTMELHEKLEGAHGKKKGPVNYAKFWQIIVQIVILDAVFSLDSVITAVGMADHLSVMMIAVCIAIGLMILAANPLMNFVSAHPTVVILCLGFLLMIGFSLIVDGLGYHIPKGYLYAAIGFSVGIEALNQLAQRNRLKSFAIIDPRTRLSQAVLGLLGTKSAKNEAITREISALSVTPDDTHVFDPQERLMMGRVLQLGEMTVESVMTPRHDLYWIDLKDNTELLEREIRECTYSCMVVAGENGIEEPQGVIYKKELADFLLQKKDLGMLHEIVRQPVTMPDSVNILSAMEMFRKSRVHAAFVVDEYGTLEGLVTLTDIAEAILGDMPEDHDEDGFRYRQHKDGSWTFNGSLALQDIRDFLGPVELPEGDYHTAAGIMLMALKRLPHTGDEIEIPGWKIVVEAMDGRRVGRLKFVPINA